MSCPICGKSMEAEVITCTQCGIVACSEHFDTEQTPGQKKCPRCAENYRKWNPDVRQPAVVLTAYLEKREHMEREIAELKEKLKQERGKSKRLRKRLQACGHHRIRRDDVREYFKIIGEGCGGYEFDAEFETADEAFEVRSGMDSGESFAVVQIIETRLPDPPEEDLVV